MIKITNHLWILGDTTVHCSAVIVPYRPQRGPTYACGGEPAEGGYAEDLSVWLERPPPAGATAAEPSRLYITDFLTEAERRAILADIYACWSEEQWP